MKQAFLIMAHKNYGQLDKLIKALDNKDVDIFLHINKQSPKYELPITKFSTIIQIPSSRTNWGSYSLVECELRLIETALGHGSYGFLHLLSGQDLPIKPVDEILSLFNAHNGFNFIHYDRPETSEQMSTRAKYYYLFQERKVRGKRSIWSISQKIVVELQKFLNIDRTRKFSGEFKSGSQWWSIRSDLAEYVVSQRLMIKKLFKYTMCDEMFMQTLVFNSRFFDTVYIGEDNDPHGNQRLIDFERGKPYIWRINDLDEIKNSDLLFARKFDETVDNEIIDRVVDMDVVKKRTIKNTEEDGRC